MSSSTQNVIEPKRTSTSISNTEPIISSTTESGIFQLKEVHLKNFRNFTDLIVPLHENLTVLAAPNGAGKSAVIDACRLLLQNFVSQFDLADEKDPKLSKDDILSGPVQTHILPHIFFLLKINNLRHFSSAFNNDKPLPTSMKRNDKTAFCTINRQK